jgi:3-isopropylmalate/(R)-2-methylmalate dehydratase large subunit
VNYDDVTVTTVPEVGKDFISQSPLPPSIGLPQTISEKILSDRSGSDASAGDIVIARVDLLMAQDGTAPLAIRAFEDMGGGSVWDPDRIALVLDHNAPSPSEGVSRLHSAIREFATDQGIGNLYDVGCGICHQLMPEKGHVKPGDLVVGADSHTCTYGALNAFATGVGSTDAAAVMKTGRLWFRVPSSARVEFTGSMPPGVYSKDVILHLVGRVGAAGATYMALELTGDAVAGMSVDSRMTMCNMAVEMGAKTAIVESDGKTQDYVGDGKGISPDDGATYDWRLKIDVGEMVPAVARPHRVDDVVAVGEVGGTPIQEALLGTCTNGRLEDLRVAAEILRGEHVGDGVRLVLAPASRDIMMAAIREGTYETLLEAGAIPVTPGCGPCVGTHDGIPGDGESVISTANRNFKGRMGNSQASIYLASPATVAASSIEGRIADPRDYL